jgi:hypothetical protein
MTERTSIEPNMPDGELRYISLVALRMRREWLPAAPGGPAGRGASSPTPYRHTQGSRRPCGFGDMAMQAARGKDWG